MEDYIAVLSLEVGPQALQESVGVGPRVEVRRVAASYLRLVYLYVVLGLVLLADRYVADLLEPKVDGIGLPYLDAGPEDGVERFGHVEVPHTAAGQAGGAGTRARLIDEDHVAARSLSCAL